MSNFDKITDFIGKATEGIEKWIKATTSAQNSRILGAALSDAGMGAAVGAVGGLFTDQGITEGALSGAILGAGAGALMKRSQILESKASTKNVDRMRRQRDAANGAVKKLEKVVEDRIDLGKPRTFVDKIMGREGTEKFGPEIAGRIKAVRRREDIVTGKWHSDSSSHQV